MNADKWRSRPGEVGDRERDRALSSLSDLLQTHLQEFGGGLR